MNVLIFSGGTGSVAIQTGFHELFNDNLDVKVLTNTQDNGKSTGTVRKVLDGLINGPSDLRKNQTLRHKLLYGNTALLKLLDIRFDCPSENAQRYCRELIHSVENTDGTVNFAVVGIMLDAIDTYFSFAKATQVDYSDFSISNIIYAGLAAKNNFSLAAAGKIMAKNILAISDQAVLQSDDTSNYLQAITQSGKIILDEGDIVDWNNPSDKIVDTFFTDRTGKVVLAKLSDECVNAIHEADIIVFSSGTQWSSLIPTYQHAGFKEAMAASKAKKYLVINNTQDKDMTGVTASEMLNVLNNYVNFKNNNITCVFNTEAVKDMKVDEEYMKSIGWNYINADLSVNNQQGKNRHDGTKLVKSIMFDYFARPLLNKTIVLDYDDTIVGRNSSHPAVSKENKSLIWELLKANKKNIAICTGNSIKAVNLDDGNLKYRSGDIAIYAENGVNRYDMKLTFDNGVDYVSTLTMSQATVIAPEFIFDKSQTASIISMLEANGINISKIQNRGDAIISIKPVDDEYRKPIANLIRTFLPDLTVRETGRTTIDISLGANKSVILSDILSTLDDNEGTITVVGDEGHEGGNDYELSACPAVNFVNVKSPRDTFVFLKTAALHSNIGRF